MWRVSGASAPLSDGGAGVDRVLVEVDHSPQLGPSLQLLQGSGVRGHDTAGGMVWPYLEVVQDVVVFGEGH